MLRRLMVLLCASALGLLTMGAHAPVPMYTPEPIPAPVGATATNLANAIQQTLLGRGWGVDATKLSEGEESSSIVATLHVRVHVLTIKIEFDRERIQFYYVSSANLGYKETAKGRYIHPKYATWIKNLESDLKGRLVDASK